MVLIVDAPAQALVLRVEVPVRILRADGLIELVAVVAAVETQFEVPLLRAGGASSSCKRPSPRQPRLKNWVSAGGW